VTVVTCSECFCFDSHGWSGGWVLFGPQLPALRALCTSSCLSPKLSLSIPLRGPHRAQKEFTSQPIPRYTSRNSFLFFCTPRHHPLIIITLSCLVFLMSISYLSILPCVLCFLYIFYLLLGFMLLISYSI
jgi:hypothetical protein